MEEADNKNNVPETCISAQLVEASKPLVFRDLPLPTPGSDKILIKLEYSGVCHSDVHMKNMYWDLLKPSFSKEKGRTLGHEGVGKVIALGPNVTCLAIGDRVICPWIHTTCLECEYCLSGHENLCLKLTNLGGHTDGTFAQCVIGHASFCRKVPEGLSSEDAGPIACAGVTTYKALKVSGVRPGQWVCIAGGAGGLGHIAVQYAKYMGMKTVGIDCTEKMEFMENMLGYDVVLDAKDPRLIATIIEKTNGGPHGFINCTSVHKCVEDAVYYVRPKGTIICAGVPNGTMAIDAVVLVAKELTIKGSLIGTRVDLDEALAIAADGKVKPVIEIRKFKEANQALDDLQSGKVKGRLVLDISQV